MRLWCTCGIHTALCCASEWALVLQRGEGGDVCVVLLQPGGVPPAHRWAGQRALDYSDTPTHTQMEVDSLILKLSPMHTGVLDNVELRWNQGCLVTLYRTCRHTHVHTAHV